MYRTSHDGRGCFTSHASLLTSLPAVWINLEHHDIKSSHIRLMCIEQDRYGAGPSGPQPMINMVTGEGFLNFDSEAGVNFSVRNSISCSYWGGCRKGICDHLHGVANGLSLMRSLSSRVAFVSAVSLRIRVNARDGTRTTHSVEIDLCPLDFGELL